MKTFNRNTTSNVKQAKKDAKHLRTLRKCGGNIALFEKSKAPKPNFITTPAANEVWDDYEYGGAYA